MSITQWLDYDAWATAKLLEAVNGLSAQQFVHEFAASVSGSQTSVRQQAVHLLSVSDRYRARIMQEAVPDVAPESFATPQELMLYAAQVRARMVQLHEHLPHDDLQRVIEHATRKGMFRASLEQTLMHMTNHANFHRGQIACLLKLHDVPFDDTDFIIWINQT